MNTEQDQALLHDYVQGKLSGREIDDLIERLGREPDLAYRLEFIRASDIAETTVLSAVYDEQRLSSVMRLIETTQPETVTEKIAAYIAPLFQRTVAIAAGVAFFLGFLLGAVLT